MKQRQKVLIALLALLVGTALFGATASADHVAIVSCGVDSKGNIVVETVDTNRSSGVLSTGRTFFSCSQILHEIMSQGYRIDATFMSSADQMMFVLTQIHK